MSVDTLTPKFKRSLILSTRTLQNTFIYKFTYLMVMKIFEVGSIIPLSQLRKQRHRKIQLPSYK